MADEERVPIDLNSSSEKELAQLPGVGETLARRIVAGRPYDDVSDLQRLEGLGKRKVEQLTPHLTVSPPAEPQEGAEQGEEESDVVPEQAADFRPRNLGWIAVGVVVAVLASVVLNLAILATINGGLSYSRRTSERVIVQDLGALQADLAQLERRLRAAEQESARLSNLANRLDLAAQSLETVGSEIDQMSADLDAMQDRLAVVETQSERWERFLLGLQSMLEGLLEQPAVDQDSGDAAQ